MNVAEGFNKSFVSVGPKLAGEIIPPEEGSADLIYGSRNPATMFLGKVYEKEIIELVSKFKNKRSMDWNGIDMILVKLLTIPVFSGQMTVYRT